MFFMLCCSIENYAEFSQAVFVPFILFIAAGSRAQTILRTAISIPQTGKVRASQLTGRSYAPTAPILPR
jgi:hypothetical protein